MKYIEEKIKIRDLVKNYTDDGDGGVYAFDDKLVCRPEYQREFVYPPKDRDEVLVTVREGAPLGLFYWNKRDDGRYEILDGQQRTLSICQYVNKEFPLKINGNDRFFHNLTEEEKNQILDYAIDVRICDGTDTERMEWFMRINKAGKTLTEQELLNSVYVGPWLADAKNFFSKRNCVALKLSDGYLKGNPIRQEILETALSWIADRDELENGAAYMAKHQHDLDANEIWIYFQTVINWAKMLFPTVRKGVTDCQECGILYNKYHKKTYNSNTLETEVKELLLNDDVTKKLGVIPYLLSERTPHDERHLSLRAFTESQKIKKYEEQGGVCAICGKKLDIDECEMDHKLPWSKGGLTTLDNLQLLCRECNSDKSDK